jgi:hypothetical protein
MDIAEVNNRLPVEVGPDQAAVHGFTDAVDESRLV